MAENSNHLTHTSEHGTCSGLGQAWLIMAGALHALFVLPTPVRLSSRHSTQVGPHVVRFGLRDKEALRPWAPELFLLFSSDSLFSFLGFHIHRNYFHLKS